MFPLMKYIFAGKSVNIFQRLFLQSDLHKSSYNITRKYLKISEINIFGENLAALLNVMRFSLAWQ